MPQSGLVTRTILPVLLLYIAVGYTETEASMLPNEYQHMLEGSVDSS